MGNRFKQFIAQELFIHLHPSLILNGDFKISIKYRQTFTIFHILNIKYPPPAFVNKIKVIKNLTLIAMNNPGITGWIAIALMFTLGFLRSAGGIMLIIKKELLDPAIIASSLQAVICGAGLLIIGIAEISAAIGIIAGKRSFIISGIIVTALFVIDGLINGYILYGKPMDGGTIANLVTAAIIISLLAYRLKLNEN